MSDRSAGSATGVLEVLQKGGGFLRDPAQSFAPARTDVFVPQKMIQKWNLSTGALVVLWRRRPRVQRPRLAQELIHQRGLAVVDVRDDGDVAKMLGGHRFTPG